MDVQSGFGLGPLQQRIQAHHQQQQEKSDSVHDSSPMDQAACCSTAARSPAAVADPGFGRGEGAERPCPRRGQ